MQPSITTVHRQPPSITPTRLLSWLILTPFLLLLSFLLSSVIVAALLQTIGLDRPAEPTLAGRVVLSLSMGILTTLSIGYLWHPLVPLRPWRWLIATSAVTSIGVLATLQVIGSVQDSATFPRAWLLPTIAIGAVLGSQQWLVLRQHTRYAGWWLPLMTGGWAAVWFLMVGLAWLLAD